MKSYITEPLGLFGWKNLEAVLLAALATEEPLLLIGKHGSAKSFLLEKLAKTLNMNFKCYNASLINYDDLVGIPIPSDDRKSLQYISNPSSIWNAQIVFIDEINRTKPELQNKLFPIIYERRVQGIQLENLKYRWAAMNPPFSDEEHDEDEYFGTMPLDPALCDRFSYIIRVPTWKNISPSERLEILNDQYVGEHEFPVDINKLIKRVKKKYEELIRKYSNVSAKYISTLVDCLNEGIGYVSIRRANILQDSFLAIHAARIVLSSLEDNNEKISLLDSAILSALNTLPHYAQKPVDDLKVMTIVKNAYTLMEMENSPLKDALLESDPLKRAIIALLNCDKIDFMQLSDMITSALSKLDKYEKRAFCLLAYLKMRKIVKLPASTMEVLANEIRPCFELDDKKHTYTYDASNAIVNLVIECCAKKELEPQLAKYRENLLNSFLPYGYDCCDDVTYLNNLFVDLAKKLKLGEKQ